MVNAKNFKECQLTVNKSITLALTSALYDKISAKQLIYIASKFILPRGLISIFLKVLCMLLGQSIHSKSYEISLDSIYALIFLWPGIRAAVICMPFFSAHSQTGFIIKLYNSKWHVPNLLIHAAAIELKKTLYEYHDAWQLKWDLKQWILIWKYLYLSCAHPWSSCWSFFCFCQFQGFALIQFSVVQGY